MQTMTLTDGTVLTVRRCATQIEISIEGGRSEGRMAWLDPVVFAREALHVELWARQREILQAAALAPTCAEAFRLAVRGGHKCGKSLMVAVLALWWLATQRDAHVLLVAPTFGQLHQIVWRMIRDRLDAAWHLPKDSRFREIAHALINLEDLDAESVATDVLERERVRTHQHQLFLIDQEEHVAPEIWDAIEENLAAGRDSLAVFSVPSATGGRFFDAFHANASLWQRFHISSEETPNVKSGTKTVPGLATHAWVEEKRVEWGPDYAKDPRYQVRVQGVFSSVEAAR